MNSTAPPTATSNVIIGVDTHKHVHVAVVIDDAGQGAAPALVDF